MEFDLRLLHIVYVEDNTDIRDLVTELTDNAERCIVGCAGAEAAWQPLQLQSFDVLVPDVSLPGLSGAELSCRWLEADASR